MFFGYISNKKFSFTADRDILVQGLGIYGLVPVVKPHIGYVDDKQSTWSCQVEIQVKNYDVIINKQIFIKFLTKIQHNK